MHEINQKDFQVYIKYWGANHSKNQLPLPHERWQSKIKLEISTTEKIVLTPEKRKIAHPYTDCLAFSNEIYCYPIYEMIAEKLRALKQRSYTAPRDFYYLFMLTNDFTVEDWNRTKEIFLIKMLHKNFIYNSYMDIIDDSKIPTVMNAWNSSLAHQIPETNLPLADEIITTVITRIKEYL
jgi:predicted nucleotidyltransferase component of viral defense system